MQIGLPTDVKHVAHIGSDGPSTNDPPSWVGIHNIFFSPPTHIHTHIRIYVCIHVSITITKTREWYSN